MTDKTFSDLDFFDDVELADDEEISEETISELTDGKGDED